MDQPPLPCSNNEPDYQRILQRIDRQTVFVGEQVGSLAKWLMASLLAINGAGAAAAIKIEKVGSGGWIAGLIFAAGIGFAMMSGLTMQNHYNQLSELLAEADLYWSGVATSSERDQAVESGYQLKRKHLTARAWVPPTMGWFSGIAFVVGALWLGVIAT